MAFEQLDREGAPLWLGERPLDDHQQVDIALGSVEAARRQRTVQVHRGDVRGSDDGLDDRPHPPANVVVDNAPLLSSTGRVIHFVTSQQRHTPSSQHPATTSIGALFSE
jgi:hypothetical protein